jgi:hypothetical protein
MFQTLSKKLSDCRTSLAATAEEISSPENTSDDFDGMKKKAKVGQYQQQHTLMK